MQVCSLHGTVPEEAVEYICAKVCPNIQLDLKLKFYVLGLAGHQRGDDQERRLLAKRRRRSRALHPGGISATGDVGGNSSFCFSFDMFARLILIMRTGGVELRRQVAQGSLAGPRCKAPGPRIFPRVASLPRFGKLTWQSRSCM